MQASQRATTRSGALLGVFGSALLHGLGYALLQWAGTMPAIDFELQLPNEVTFGVTEPARPQTEVPVAETPPQTAQAAPLQEAVAPRKKPRKKKPEPIDAGVADAAPAEARPAVADAGPDSAASDAGSPLLSAFAPEGTQIALRLHMGRIRDTELAADVRMLLDAVPDWRAIVEGSGLDPLRDLERLYIATPDLKRSSLVMAGQYLGGVEMPQRAVQNLAAARGVKARWRVRAGVRVAPWANADATERVLALIAPGQFAITRPDDLKRVLDVARALSQREGAAVTSDAQAADALLGLRQDETLALAVEGARHFVGQGNTRGIPERLAASVGSAEGGGLAVHITGHFESEQAAETARDYWNTLRERFAAHPLVSLIGMRAPLTAAEFSVEGSALQVRTHVTVQQARVVLGFIANALRPPAPQP